jgi:RNA polymerase sigma-70 factor (ECF subfamily)
MSVDANRRPAALPVADEIRLVSSAKHGDSASFEALVERYLGKAIGVAMGYVRNRDDAAELAQDAFLRAWRALSGFRDGEPFAPWFFRILRNGCLSFLERRKHRRALSIDARRDDDSPAFELRDEGARRPDELVDSKHAHEAFLAALDKLSLPHREIILLRHVEDLEYAEIATVLEIPIGTVMSRLFHARRKLREHLHTWFPADEERTPTARAASGRGRPERA